MRSCRRPNRVGCCAKPITRKCKVRNPVGLKQAKYRAFTESPAMTPDNTELSQLPGFTKTNLKRLRSLGFWSTACLFNKMMELGGDKFCFVNWLVSVVYMKRDKADSCYKCLHDWCHRNPNRNHLADKPANCRVGHCNCSKVADDDDDDGDDDDDDCDGASTAQTPMNVLTSIKDILQSKRHRSRTVTEDGKTGGFRQILYNSTASGLNNGKH
ncbi:hypothetical protein LSAT2_013790 [Lamellibrachia satsuma]|nr:hypothetical protein LSAT2_013790 [Lamellibrachia satsuma]